MKPIHITIGIFLMLIMIFLSNIIVFSTITDIFLIPFSPIILESILFLFSVGFFIALLVGMKHNNFFIRTLYIFTSFGFGIFIYIFFSSLIYLTIFLTFNKNFIIFGEVMITLPILLGIYGTINASKLYVKSLEITLPHTPKDWQGKKVVWISDVHIGLVYGKNYVKKIVKKINSLKPDIIFIGGDLFDGVSMPAIINFADPLRDLKAPLGIYFVSGNHELYGKTEDFYKKIRSLGIKILDDEIMEISGMQIIGIGFSKKIRKDKYRKQLENLNINREKPSILLKHEPRDIRIAEEAGISLQISGHTHNAQQWPLNYYARAIYKKYTYGLKRKGGMQIYTSSGAGTWGPAIRVGSKCEVVEIIIK